MVVCGNDGFQKNREREGGRQRVRGGLEERRHWQKRLLRYAPLGVGVAFGVLPAWLHWLGVRVSVCESY